MNLSVSVCAARRAARVAFCVIAPILAAATARGQAVTSDSPLDPPPNGPRRAEPAAFALTNVTAHVRPGETVEGATLVVRDGRIVSVGKGGGEPGPGVRVRDGAGLHVYAGFIEPFLEIDVPRPAADAPGSHWNDAVTPQRSALDRGAAGIDKGTGETLRSLGFAAAAIAPRGGIFAGRGAVVSLAERPEDASLAGPRVYRVDAYSLVQFELQREGREDDVRWGGYPNSEMGAIALIRQTLSDADWERARGEGARGESAGGALAALMGGVGGRGARLWFNVSDELEALRAAKIGAEFGRDVVVIGSGKEHRRLSALKATGRPVVLPLAFPKPPKVGSVGEQDAVELRELIEWEQAPTNPRRVDGAGIAAALTSSKIPDKLGGRGAFRENLSSAIKHGLKPERALAMLTTQPAEMLGVSETLGTLEPGKAANVVVADGPLFMDRPDGPKKGEPGFAREARIVEVWADGRRHLVAPRARDDLEGVWAVTVEPGPKAGAGGTVSVTYEIENDPPALVPKITVVKRSKNEKGEDQRATTAARELAIDEDGRVRFVLDHSPLGEVGVFTATGTIEKSESGPVMRGDAVRSTGERLRWTAVRTSTVVPKEDKKAGNAEGKERGAEGAQKNGGEKAGGKAEDPPAGGADGNGAGQGAKEGAVSAGGPGVPPADAGGSVKPADAEKKAEDKPRETPEGDAIAQIPERLGLPVGPYALDEPPAQEAVVLRHATVWTCSDAGVIEDGAVYIADGKIAFVGTDGAWAELMTRVKLSRLPREIDLSGRHVSPGIIDCHSHTGISKGVNESGQAVTAEVRIGDVTDPDSISWYRQLGGGVTTVNSLHGSANPIGGQNQVNKNRWGCAAPDGMHFEGAIPGIKFALGENVKLGNSGDRYTTRYPQTRMGVEALIRERFGAARAYLDAMKGPNPPRRDLELEALGEILEGKRLVHCHSYRQDEILMLCRVAEEFGFRIGTFQHGLEVYKVADEVREHAIGASLFADWWGYKIEVQDAIPAAGPLQTEVGVLTSYNSDSDEMARRMNVEAGKAAKYSGGRITPEAALKFVTINPAKQLKIDSRVGSIETGKDADLAVWSGVPTSSLSRCERTFVDGRELFSLEKDAALRKRNEAERARIVQKVLALASPGERARPAKDDKGIPQRSGEKTGDPTKPTLEVSVDAEAARAAGRSLLVYEAYRRFLASRREAFLGLLQRGLDPRFHTAGSCGCEEY